MIRSTKLGLGFDFNNNLNHATSGVLTSEWFDTASSGLVVSWLAETVTQSVPSGCFTKIEYRVNNDKSNTTFVSSPRFLEGRYIQARISLAKNEFAAANPTVDLVQVKPQVKGQDETVNLFSASNNNSDVETTTDWVNGILKTVYKIDSTTNASFEDFQPDRYLTITSGSKFVITFKFKGTVFPVTDFRCLDSSNAVLGPATVTWTKYPTVSSTEYREFEAIVSAFPANSVKFEPFRWYYNASQDEIGHFADVQVEERPYSTPYIAPGSTRPSPKAVMIEDGATNVLTYSEDFSDSSWTKVASSITSNAVVAPDGTLTADKLIESATTADHYVVKGGNLTTLGNPTTLSVYAKAGERNWVFLNKDNGGAWFNLVSGVIGAITNGYTANIIPVGNGWYRCTLTQAARTSGSYRVNVVTDNNIISYAGDGISGIYIWGAQNEEKFYPTSYIKTGSTNVTRNADNLSIPGPSVVNPAKGAFVIRAYVDEEANSTTSRTRNVGGLGTSAVNNRIELQRVNNNWHAVGVNTAYGNKSATFAGQIGVGWHTFGVRWNSSELSLWIDGVKRATVSAPVLPDSMTGTTFDVGRLGDNTRYWGNLIESVAIFHEDPTDTEMAAYTISSGIITLSEKTSYRIDFNNSTLAHGEGGYRITPAYTLTDLETVTSGYVAWNATAGASGVVAVDVSSDNGATWYPAISSGSVFGLDNLAASGKVLLVKQKFTTTNIGSVPSIADMTIRVGQRWKNAASQYIKALFTKLTLIPSGIAKWQLENKKYMTTFMNGTRAAEVLSVPGSGIIKSNGSLIVRAYVDGELLNSTMGSARRLFMHTKSGTLQNVVSILRNTAGTYVASVTGTNGQGPLTFSSSNLILSKGWHTFGATWTSDTVTLWIDGVKIATSAKFTHSLSNDSLNTITVGSHTDGTLAWSQPIDEVHVFGDALTDSEMATYTNLSMDTTISINSKHTYRHKFTNNLNYGTCGVYVSKWLDAGINANGSPWVDIDYEAITPEGTSVGFAFRASDTPNSAANAPWYNTITDAAVRGRYIQVKVFLMSEDATTATPVVNRFEPIPKFA